jgi:hypothetical protein
MIHQLRVYEIFDANRGAFHDRFRDHALRIMGRHGFTVLHTWERVVDGRRSFVYLLAWPDEATMRDAWPRFLADEEWREIKRVTAARHGDLVGEIEDWTLVPTAYTPGR